MPRQLAITVEVGRRKRAVIEFAVSGNSDETMQSRTTVRIPFLDTHTGGEPTRVVLSAPPGLSAEGLSGLVAKLKTDWDWFRRAVILAPRGNESMVGALVTTTEQTGHDAGVIFFNNAGYLGMCGHGTIGVAVGLHAIGKLAPGPFRLGTPVGTVRGELITASRARFENIRCYVYRQDVTVQLGDQTIHGDIAWGGNWFFICEDHGQELSLEREPVLTQFCWQIRRELERQRVTGPGGEMIDHIELIGPPPDPSVADAQNFVLCPGGEFDRSPCGTGTSAKLACLALRGRLEPGQIHRQQSIVGSVFTAKYRCDDESTGIYPTIEGDAYVTAMGELVLDPNDPFCQGIPA